MNQKHFKNIAVDDVYDTKLCASNIQGAAEKSSPLKFFAVFSATV